MASYKTRAIVLKKTKLKETDLILTMLSERGEQIRCVAKGARKPGGSFAARLELFGEADLMLYEGKNLDTVTEARIVESNEGCRADVEHLSYGAVIAEFVEKTALEGQENPIMFSLTKAALEAVGANPVEKLPFMIAAYLLKAVAYLGYRPSFDECTICGADASAAGASEGAQTGAFSVSSGGWICSECVELGELDPADTVDQAICAWVRSLLGLRFSEIPERLDSDTTGYRALAGELLSFCEVWFSSHMGIRLKSLDYLARIFI